MARSSRRDPSTVRTDAMSASPLPIRARYTPLGAFAIEGLFDAVARAGSSTQGRGSSYFSRRCFFSLTSFHWSASGGAGLRSTMGFQTLESSALSAMNSFWSAGTSSSAKIASTGHSATQSVQSMHSSGSMTRMFGPSRQQSTGQTSTQSVYLHLMQDSVTTYVMKRTLSRGLVKREKDQHFSTGPVRAPTRGFARKPGFSLRLHPYDAPVHPRTLHPGDIPTSPRGNMAEKILHITDDTFETEVLQSQTPVLVDYWAEWCGPCKMIAPALDQIASEYAGRLKVAKLNIDENQSTPPKYGIRGIPTLMLFKNGAVEATKVGALSKTQLAAFIDSNI